MANFVAHFAVYADDLDRAQRFYAQVFGWRFSPWGPPGYFKIHTSDGDPGVTHGGLSERQTPLATTSGGDPGVNAYRCSIAVEDADATIAAIETAGGRLHGPLLELPGIGKIQEFVDTEENRACIVEYTDDALDSMGLRA